MEDILIASDTFESCDAAFALLHGSLPGTHKKRITFQYLSLTRARTLSLRIIRSASNDFMDHVNRDSCEHLALLYLTSLSDAEIKDFGLNTDDIHCPRLGAEFIIGNFNKAVASGRNLYRPRRTLDKCSYIQFADYKKLKKNDREYEILETIKKSGVSIDLITRNPGVTWNWYMISRSPHINPADLIKLRGPYVNTNLHMNPNLTAETVNSNPAVPWSMKKLSNYMHVKELEKLNHVSYEDVYMNPSLTSEFILEHFNEIPTYNLNFFKNPSAELVEALKAVDPEERRLFSSSTKKIAALDRNIMRYSALSLVNTSRKFGEFLELMDFSAADRFIAMRTLNLAGLCNDISAHVMKYIVN